MYLWNDNIVACFPKLVLFIEGRSANPVANSRNKVPQYQR